MIGAQQHTFGTYMLSKPVQSRRPFRSFLMAFTLLFGGLMTQHAPASDPTQNRLSGLWYDPALNGQGFQFQVFGEADSAQLFAIWYTHKQGRPVWFYGAAPLSDRSGL